MVHSELCYFVVEADDQTTEDQLEPYNQKFLQVYFERFDGLDIYISNATSEMVLQEDGIIKVNTTYRNFTMPPTKKFYITINTTDGAVYPQMKGQILFRYYTYDAGCPVFTYWNRTHCVPNYYEYCSNLTIAYQLYTNNTEAYVYFNGSSCIVSQGAEETEVK